MTSADSSIPNIQSNTMPATLSPSTIPQLTYDGQPATSASSPLGSKHEPKLPHLTSALHAGIKFQKLAFYDLLYELIKPTSLASAKSQYFREASFEFTLTVQQAHQIISSMYVSGPKCEFGIQVQLRFCLSETSCPQEDYFPPNLCVKVNGRTYSHSDYLLPIRNGVEPKKRNQPINITSLVQFSTTIPNTIVVSWTTEIGRNYSMAVHLVKPLSSTVLIQRLQAKGIRNPDHSRALIKEKLTADPDSEIATTSLRISLLCPLSKMRLTTPCRGLTCSHLQCFDATVYIQMNEKKPAWVCPVCDKKAPYEHLFIDGLFMEILKCCTDCDEIQFKEDGSWVPMTSKMEVQEASASYNGVDGCLDSPLDHPLSSQHQSSNKNKRVQVIDLTIDSSSDEEKEGPSAKQTCPSRSPAPPLNNRGILNMPHQASAVSRTPGFPAVGTSYINRSLIQDYRPPFLMTPMPYNVQGLPLYPFLSGNNQHYNTPRLATAAAATSDDVERLRSSCFFPYASSPMFLHQLNAGGSTALPTRNGNYTGRNSSLAPSNSLRESHSLPVANRSGTHTASVSGIIPGIISKD